MPIFNPVLIGGGGAKPGEPLDPVQVYKDTRPVDWVSLPAPNENEMVFLYLFSTDEVKLNVTAYFDSAESANLSIRFGNMEGNVFVPVGEPTVVSTKDAVINGFTLLASSFTAVTSDGMKQAVVRIELDSPCTGFSFYPRESRPELNIVDVRANLPYVKQLFDAFGHHTPANALQKLQYISIENERKAESAFSMHGGFKNCTNLKAVMSLPPMISSLTEAFRGCQNLVALPELSCVNTAKVDFAYAFRDCYRLQSISVSRGTKAGDLLSTFNNCYLLKCVRNLDTSESTTMSRMLWNCFSLEEFPKLNTQNVTDMYAMCYGARSLKELSILDMSKVTNTEFIVGGAQRLQKVLFDPDAVWESPQDLNMQNMSLPIEAIIEMFNSLPAIQTTKTLNIAGNAWVNMLTDADKTIATEKGWTLTL